jgi:hypothetical protein
MALRATAEMLPEKFPIAAEAAQQILHHAEGAFPGFEKLCEHYNDSVIAIAGSFPMLAFQLRSKDIAGPALQKMRAFVPQQCQSCCTFRDH